MKKIVVQICSKQKFKIITNILYFIKPLMAIWTHTNKKQITNKCSQTNNIIIRIITNDGISI